MYDAGNPKSVFCNNLEGWSREGSGRGVQEGGDKCMPVGRFMLMYGRGHHNIVIILQLTYIYIKIVKLQTRGIHPTETATLIPSAKDALNSNLEIFSTSCSPNFKTECIIC